MATSNLEHALYEASLGPSPIVVPATVDDSVSRIAASIVAKARETGSIVDPFKVHLDQPYLPTLCTELVNADPEMALQLFSEARSNGCGGMEQAILAAVQNLEPREMLSYYSDYDFLPEAAAIRSAAINDLLKNYPGDVLEQPELIHDAEDFEKTYLDAYQRATPEERVGILKPAGAPLQNLSEGDSSSELDYSLEISPNSIDLATLQLLDPSLDLSKHLLPDAEASKVILTEPMLQEAVAQALITNPDKIAFEPEWLGKQEWFRKIEPDFKAIAEITDPYIAVGSLELLKNAGMKVPEQVVDKVVGRLLSEEPQGIFSEITEHEIATLGVSPGRILEMKQLALRRLIHSEPAIALSCISEHGSKLFSEDLKEQYLSRATQSAYDNHPEAYLSLAMRFPLPGSSAESSLTQGASLLAAQNPAMLLKNFDQLAPLQDEVKQSTLVTALQNLQESDPAAILDFIKEHRSDEAIQKAVEKIDLVDVLIQAAKKAPTEVFHNYELIEDSIHADEVLRTAVFKLKSDDVLRYTGLPKVDSSLTDSQLEHIRGNMQSLKQWVLDPYHPDYSAMFQDQAALRALQIRPEWIDQSKMVDFERADLRLIVGRNLYAQNKSITQQHVAEELAHIEAVRDKFGAVELFRGRTVLFAADNERWKEGESRFARNGIIESLDLAAGKPIEKYFAVEDALTAKEEKQLFLERIRHCEEPVTIFMNAHGKMFDIEENGMISLTPQTQIWISELSDAFNERLEKRQLNGDSKPEERDIIIFNNCYSYNLARTFYDSLSQEQSEGLPIAIGTSELGQFGFSNTESQLNSNFTEHVLGLGAVTKDNGFSPTIGDVIQNQIKDKEANCYVFAPNEKVPYLQIGKLESLKFPSVRVG